MNLDAIDSLIVGIILVVGAVYLVIRRRVMENMFLRVSADARARAENEPWPWWRWPKPTERLMTFMSWLAPCVVLGVGAFALTQAFQ